MCVCVCVCGSWTSVCVRERERKRERKREREREREFKGFYDDSQLFCIGIFDSEWFNIGTSTTQKLEMIIKIFDVCAVLGSSWPCDTWFRV